MLRSPKSEKLPRPTNLQIEHVMPSTWQPTWKLKSGAFAPADYASLDGFLNDDPLYVEARERDQVVDTLGNLTLITAPLNQGYGNDPFAEKKEELEAHTILLLNRSIRDQTAWDVVQIRSRSDMLACLALKRWRRP